MDCVTHVIGAGVSFAQGARCDADQFGLPGDALRYPFVASHTPLIPDLEGLCYAADSTTLPLH